MKTETKYLNYSSGVGTNMPGLIQKITAEISAEISVAMAKESQKILESMSLDKREQIIANIRTATLENAEQLASMAVEETGMGNASHKILKNRLVAEKTPGTENVRQGITNSSLSPFGVIGAITPSTNPSETVICNTIGMLAGGNTVIFSPHPNALNTSRYAIDLVNRASAKAGGPDRIAFYASSVDMILDHKDIQLIVATGGPGLVDVVLKSGKRGIGAGAGNPPVLVDETANLRKAAEDIINGCTFDNNLPCIAEKSIVATADIADDLMSLMVNEQNCYLADEQELAKLRSLIFTEKGLNRKCVGKSADTLLRMIGVRPHGVELSGNGSGSSGVRCIVFEGVKEDRLIAEELMMPILGMVRAKNFDNALETALWLEHGYRHSAHIHSRNIDRLNAYQKAMNTTIMVKNAPSYAALGFESDGYCSFTIASRTGEGLTSASTFMKKRFTAMGA